jgi:hypothetical protein
MSSRHNGHEDDDDDVSMVERGCVLASKDASAELLRDDKKDVILAACRLHGNNALEHASEELRTDRNFILEVCQQNGTALEFAPAAAALFGNDRGVLLAACSQTGWALEFAAMNLRNDPEIVLVACRQNGSALRFASRPLKGDAEIVLAACQSNGMALKFAEPDFRNDRDVVLAACNSNGMALQFASEQFKTSDREIVLAACANNGWAFKHADRTFHSDREIVLAACASNGLALQFVPEHFQTRDREVVLAACSNNGWALQHTSDTFKADKEIVLAACTQTGGALQHASAALCADKTVVLAAVTHTGGVLRYASEDLQADKDVVIAAATSSPASLKFALGGLNQDPDCLIAAKLWETDLSSLSTTAAATKIVLSTRFSLDKNSSPNATQFTVALKQTPYIRDNHFVVYSPNAFAKNTCDPEWTSWEWPCRGTVETCRKEASLKMGVPQENACWRYSFRYQLNEAKMTRGFMIQVIDCPKSTYDGENTEYIMGKGQEIETEMASLVGTKIFKSVSAII